MSDTPVSRLMDACQRCGTCCRKGGPCLHESDRDLVERGILPLAELRTIRRGEMVYDPIMGAILSADTEMIRIAEKPGTRVCRYFQESGNRCDIYDNRPLECRVLKCWDTRDIEYRYRRDRLSRKSILGQIPGLMDLVEAHEKGCPVSRYMRLIVLAKTSPASETARQLREMIVFDREIRRLTVEKSRLDPRMLRFLFGLPLTELPGQPRR